MDMQSKTVVVTGGGSGIGRQLVLELLSRGANVAAIDLNMDGLEETAKLAGTPTNLSLHQVNITDRERVMALPAEIEQTHGKIDIILNNAGIIQPFTPVSDLSFDVIDRMIEVNLVGTINMVKAFLPALAARPQAQIINVSSMGGFMPFPGQTMYGAAKAGVKLLTEGLYAELKDTNIQVSLVMPGAVSTNIVANSGLEQKASSGSSEQDNRSLPADEAAKIILDGAQTGKLHILVGKDAKLLNFLSRIAPTWSINFIQKQMAKR